jgi:hypothetical protein
VRYSSDSPHQSNTTSVNLGFTGDMHGVFNVPRWLLMSPLCSSKY